MDLYYSEFDKCAAGQEPEEGAGALVVIEDANMVYTDDQGALQATFEFIDGRTVRVHPLLMDAFLSEAEMLWTADQLVEALG